MANSIEFQTTFLGMSCAFQGTQESTTTSFLGTLDFSEEVAIGHVFAQEWQRQGVELPFPYQNATAFKRKSFTAKCASDKKELQVFLTENKNWTWCIFLNENHELTQHYLKFEPKQSINIQKLPGISSLLEAMISAKVAIYFATADANDDNLTIPKGISFRADCTIASKTFSLPTAENQLINCKNPIAPIATNQPLGSIGTIATLDFEYRKQAKNPENNHLEPNKLLLQFQMSNTPLQVIKGELKAIRIGLILDKLHLMQQFSWESNLALEVDFDIPVTDKKTGKKRLIALRPMQWLRKIGFPPSWFPSLFPKGTKRPEATKGITISKSDLENITSISQNHALQSLIPDETVLERIVYDWKTNDLELAVKVTFQSPLSKAELQALETQHSTPQALKAALIAEAQKRNIDTTNKDIAALKQALHEYNGGFALNQYPDVFKVNTVAVYFNPNKK